MSGMDIHCDCCGRICAVDVVSGPLGDLCGVRSGDPLCGIDGRDARCPSSPAWIGQRQTRSFIDVPRIRGRRIHVCLSLVWGGSASSGSKLRRRCGKVSPDTDGNSSRYEPRTWKTSSRVLAFMFDGPEIVYRSPHAVVATPYQRNTAGILDTYDFFAATDEAQAREIVDRRGIELVLLCRHGNEAQQYQGGGFGTHIV